MATTLGIVVGTDGSEHATEALSWALQEARLRQLPVTVVHAWDYNYYPAGVFVQAGTLEEESQKMLDDAVEPFRQDYSDLTINTQLVKTASGAAALAEASKDAEMVVVGSRGRGGFVGMLLGSVSNAIVHRAHCPVVVVRGE